jgi:hypothetical protein
LEPYSKPMPGIAFRAPLLIACSYPGTETTRARHEGPRDRT